MFYPPVWFDLSAVSADVALLSSIAIILGALFVVFQMRDERKMMEATVKQAIASSEQVRLGTEQLKQNHELATVDLITRLYDFANSMEFQRSWGTVLKTQISSFDDYKRLPEEKQLALQQVASLFESVGFLVDKGYVKEGIVDDMFATELAWVSLKHFIAGMREAYAAEDYYTYFEKLHKRLSGLANNRSGAYDALTP
jgi:hypothetical protein